MNKKISFLPEDYEVKTVMEYNIETLQEEIKKLKARLTTVESRTSVLSEILDRYIKEKNES